MPITPDRQAIIDANKKKTAQAGQAVLNARADTGILGTTPNATIANNAANRNAEWIGGFKQPTTPKTTLGPSTVIGPTNVPLYNGPAEGSTENFTIAQKNGLNIGGSAVGVAAGAGLSAVKGANTGLTTVIPPKPTSTDTTNTTDTTYIDTTPTYWTMEDLKGKGFGELADYLENNPEEKTIFEQMGQLSKNQVDEFLKTRSEAVQDFNIKRGRTEASAEANKKLSAIQQNQSIRSINDQLTRAKNIAGFARFSSSSSPEKNDAVSKGVAEIDKRLNEAVEMYGIINEENAAQVQETLRQMDMDIRQKVGNFLFDKLNELDQSIASGQVATPEQLDNLFRKYSDAIIKEAPILTETGIQQMSNVANAFIGQQKYLANLQQQYTQNAATFTASPAGFYVDGNGMQVMDADGKPVPVPPKPIWSGVQNGKFISVGQDEFGNLDVQEVAIPGYVAPTEKPNIIETSQGLYNASTGEWIAGPGSNVPGPSSTSVPYAPPTGFESRGAGSSVAVKNTGDGIEIGIASGTKLEGIGGQCGGLVNDFATSIPGYKKVGNDYESKLANRNSKEPVAGGLVMWTPGKFEDNGHIGIVEKVFADGSFQIYDTNYVAANTTSRRIIKPGDKEYDLIQKTGGFFDPSKAGGQKGASKDLYDLSEYIVNTQARGAGYSDEDVKQFTNSVRMYANSGDEETVYQLYRDRIMSNKEVGPKIFDNQELKSALENVRSTLQAYKESGGDTNVFSNIAEVVANKLGTTTDTQLAKANNQIGVLVADYIRAISGTAASDKEVTRLINSMPKIKNVDSFNTVILDTLEDTADTKMKASIETAMGFKGKKYASKLFPEVYGAQVDTSTQITEEDFSSI